MVLRDEGRGNKDQSDQKMAGPDAQGQGEKHIKSARKILDAQGERLDQDLFVGPLKFGQQRESIQSDCQPHDKQNHKEKQEKCVDPPSGVVTQIDIQSQEGADQSEKNPQLHTLFKVLFE